MKSLKWILKWVLFPAIGLVSGFLLLHTIAFAKTEPKFKCDEAFEKQIKEKDFVIKSTPQCVLADFDGDGQNEILVFKEIPSEKLSVTPTFLARVYFLKNGKIFRSFAIDHTFQLPPMTYRSDETYKNYGCPTSNLIGIIDPGEGGTNYIYLWQKKTLKFQEFTCRSEDA